MEQLCAQLNDFFSKKTMVEDIVVMALRDNTSVLTKYRIHHFPFYLMYFFYKRKPKHFILAIVLPLSDPFAAFLFFSLNVVYCLFCLEAYVYNVFVWSL